MNRMAFIPSAPSSAAASYVEVGSEANPAANTTIAKPIRFQIPTMITAGKANRVSDNQFGPITLNAPRDLLMTPENGSKINFQTTPAATVAVTTGEKYSVR